MNPVATFFLIFLLSLVAFATFGLEVALVAKGTVNLTVGDVLIVSGGIGIISAIFEYNAFKDWAWRNKIVITQMIVVGSLFIWVLYEIAQYAILGP